MKFGHQFTRTIEATHPTISDKVGGENRKEPRLEPRFSPAPLKPPSPTPQFLCYKKLKKCLKTIPKKTEPAKNADGTLKPGEKRKLTEEQRAFVKTLNAELHELASLQWLKGPSTPGGAATVSRVGGKRRS